jgi:hypothetical protein
MELKVWITFGAQQYDHTFPVEVEALWWADTPHSKESYQISKRLIIPETSSEL